MLRTTFLGDPDAYPAPLLGYLERCQDRAVPENVHGREVVVCAGDSLGGLSEEEWVLRAGEGRAALVLLAPALKQLGASSALVMASGIEPGQVSAVHPVRLTTAPAASPHGADPSRLAGAGFGRLGPLPDVRARVIAANAVAADVEVLLSAHLGLGVHPMVTWRPCAGVGLFTLPLDAVSSLDDGIGMRLFHRYLCWVSTSADLAEEPVARVGMLGFGAIGAEHAAGVAGTPGLALAAVCDQSARRREAAGAADPAVRTYAKADELLGDAGVDVVIVSTPPDSHARWAQAALGASKHVVVEKPLALSTADADGMVAAASGARKVLAVYQNRRFDPDFVALRRLVAKGRLGKVFHLEAFVGGYAHPCNYWHSDQAVSGGIAFDWGSHYLDQMLALVPGQLCWVRGAARKLLWHDVTNADHMRITLRFEDGTEADFVHSDLAAALKPKWYLLGTDGAAVSNWRTERVLARNAVGTLEEDVLAPADSPAEVHLHGPDGSITHVAAPEVAPGSFHRELADRLLLGEPLTADAVQSRNVVAILEAATISASRDSVPVPCELLGR